MSATISVLFYVRKSKRALPKSGKLPIRMRITVLGESFNLSTKLFIPKSDWSQTAACATGSSQETQHINSCLEGFRLKAFDCQRELMIKGVPVTLDAMRTKWYGLDRERPRMLLEIFDQHNEQMKA